MAPAGSGPAGSHSPRAAIEPASLRVANLTRGHSDVLFQGARLMTLIDAVTVIGSLALVRAMESFR
jgi:hypothetical protein